MAFATACSNPGSVDSTGTNSQALSGTMTVNAATTYQTMDGFGTNLAPRNWGTNGSGVKPVLDQMVSDLGLNLFRVEMNKGVTTWETSNDDSDPNTINWTAMDAYLTSKDMNDGYDLMRYLNTKGQTKIVVAMHGRVPSWMGGSFGGYPGTCLATDLQTGTCTGPSANAEAEYAETVLGLLRYMTERMPEPKVQFTWVGPINEPNLQPSPSGVEGTVQDAITGTRVLRKVVDRMAQYSLLDPYKIIGPEYAGTESPTTGSWHDRLSADTVVWNRMAAYAQHNYGTTTYDNLSLNKPTWTTEIGLQTSCTVGTWSNATTLADTVLQELKSNVTAVMTWDGFDNYHEHDTRWESYGLFVTGFPANSPCTDFSQNGSPPTQAQLDVATYQPKTTYYAFKHFTKFIQAGAQRISASASDSGLNFVAFKNPDTSVVIAGRNSGTSGSVTLNLSGMSPLPTSLTLYSSAAGSNFVQGSTFSLSSGSGTITLPADCVFSLVSPPVVPTVSITSPVNGASYASAPASVTINTNAAPPSGRTLTKVDFYNGATLLGTTTSSPWNYTWTNVAPGSYTLKAIATDSGNATATSNLVSVAVGNYNGGPGGPIAVLVNNSYSQYGTFYAEILRAEGLNEFSMLDLSTSDLSAYKVVILPETTLSSTQLTTLTNWVNAGGVLIAMRPDAQLNTLLGLTSVAGSLSDGYIWTDQTQWGIGGASSTSLQFHGTADYRTLNGGTTMVSKLYSAAAVDTGYPAISMRQGIGGGSGTAVAFMYDLARSTVGLRQGNSALAGAHNISDISAAVEMFFHSGSNANWLDSTKFSIPQADEQQRLMVNIINKASTAMPFPRFWYLPGGRKAAVLMAGDDHNYTGTASFMSTLNSNTLYSPAGCSASNWTCARSSGWVYTGNSITPANMATYTALGFDFGPHIALTCSSQGTCSGFPTGVDMGVMSCLEWTSYTDLYNRMSTFQAGYNAVYGTGHLGSGNRTHCAVNNDWDSQPKAESALGIRLDVNYMQYGSGTQTANASFLANVSGRMNGSGIPMRFASSTKSLIDVYQIVTDFNFEWYSNSSQANLQTEFAGLLNGATGTNGYYGIFGTHYDYSTGGNNLANAILAEVSTRNSGAAIENQVAMVSGQQILDWMDLRGSSSFTGLSYNSGTRELSFGIAVDATHPNAGLEAMLPTNMGTYSLTTITKSGVPVTVKRTMTVKGVSYSFFDASNSSAFLATYNTPSTVMPVMTSVAASSIGTTVATLNGTGNPNGAATNAFFRYSTTSPGACNNTFGTATSNQALGTGSSAVAYSQALTGLASGTTYYFCAIGTNSAGTGLGSLLSFTTSGSVGLSVDVSAVTHQSSAASTITGTITPTAAGELMLAFLASDGPGGALSFSTVTGGPTWTLVKRTNAQPGTAEIWKAISVTANAAVNVTATRSTGSYAGSMVLVAFKGANTSVGATGTGNAASGAPTASLTTTAAGSWVWGIGSDYNTITAKTVGSGQTKFDEYLLAGAGSYWVQSQTATTANSGTVVTINDTAPNNAQYDLSLVEILAASGGGPTVPDAPTIGTATGGNAQATVAFTAPGNNGGSAITGYTVTSSPGGLTASGSASPLTVNGLTNGTAYTFTAVATNAIGNSSASAASNSVTPATTPGAPTIGTATAGNTQATVAFTAPGSNGGSAITSYTATSSPGGLTASGSASPLTVGGLTNGTAYTFTVKATNAVGQGAASAASNSVTPTPSAPDAPTIGTATAGDTQATVAFTAPGNNGGSAITSYTVYSNTGGFSASGSASPLTVNGLTNGTAYTFTVKATNAIGQGPASAASNSVTPATTPGAPTIGTATAGNTQATVAFTAPGSNGGSAITSYTATSSPGGFTGSGSASPVTVAGLTNGTAYTFTVKATNAVGQGAASAASNSVTPANVPGAPTIGTATAGNAQATVAFTAPGSNGGSAITGYTVTSSPGGLTASGAGSPLTVNGLTNGTAYTFTAVATNAIGNSAASAASNSVTPATTPGAPTIGTATAGNAQATVAFTAPGSNGGSAITSYTATSSPGGFTASGSASPLTVGGLTNGTAYTFTVKATNAVGQGAASAASNSVTPSAGSVQIGNSNLETTGDAVASKEVDAFKYTSSATAGSVGTFKMYIDTGNTETTIKFGLYSDNAGTPQTLLASGTLSNPTNGWNTVTFTAYSIAANTNYWIAILGTTTNKQINFREHILSGSTTYKSMGSGLTALPATWGTTTGTWGAEKMSAYMIP